MRNRQNTVRRNKIIGVSTLVAALVIGAGGALITSNDAAAAAPTVKLPDNLKQYEEAFEKSGKICSQVTASMLAAQIDVETAMNPAAKSADGRQSASLLWDAVWNRFGIDPDGNKSTDKTNLANSISTRANYMCYLARNMRIHMNKNNGKDPAQWVNKIAPGTDLADVTIATYRVGPKHVLEQGLETFQVTSYVTQVADQLPKFTPPAQPSDPNASGSATPTVADPTGSTTPTTTPDPTKTETSGDTPTSTSAAVVTGSPSSPVVGTATETKKPSVIAPTTSDAPTATPTATPTQASKSATGTGDRTIDGIVIPKASPQADERPKEEVPSSGAVGPAIVKAAREKLGYKYQWGGGKASGPGLLLQKDTGPSGPAGFDCSGLVLYSVWQGTNAVPSTDPLLMPRIAHMQINSDAEGSGVDQANLYWMGTVEGGDTEGQNLFIKDLKPGDLVGMKKKGGFVYHHIAIYVGDGQVIHAPQKDDVVKISPLSNWKSQTWRGLRILPDA